MGTVEYKNLGLKNEPGLVIFKWNGIDIELVKNLSVSDKYDIVMITLQKSFEDGIYNPIKLDMYFHLNLVYAYSNIVFSDEDRQDEEKLYNELNTSGFLDKFLTLINENDYKEMLDNIEEISELKMKYNASAANFLRTFVDDLPGGLENAQQIIDNFDPEKYQAVVDFAKAANGGRPIS